MSKQDVVRALRDPEYRAQLNGFNHPAGLVTDEELKRIAGAADAEPQSTIPCGVVSATVSLVSAAGCPTTKCTSQCTNVDGLC
ncbi:class II lanthipeptide, LchA2/BrtA2 family [Paenactinomyces guangxiensis]|uniref:Mersacidin/lichenicidin family type 2 lantibiotic n=1 Tax=Paenactinomyces guangxiensis TaxID=1490290 RepID=A0A7W1WMK7_9BACL|nr:class II lanthipeptide, LchA2/BrtA2 family [Paenactinomyces guangxiensis]MBA4492715.1 mersacidin/lichenicidin family type 2 lantibiotic [Paenactinomyces guangxiensis]MBH8590437.1 class II lanthipeptide, LchA2/BrtA2 family [Paenactinomyces guangxiensis]